MTIASLTKERMTIRNTDPERATAILMVIDGATKIAKASNRDVTDDDIYEAARKAMNSCKKAINDIKEKSPKGSVIDPTIFDSYNKEIEQYKSFLPEGETPADPEKIVNDYIATISADTLLNSNKGNIMKAAKLVKDIDMALFSKTIGPLLK
jgi:uncharacterized protein YqeY